jgi:LysM repeat protein
MATKSKKAKTEEKPVVEKSAESEIRIKETEDDIVLDAGFTGNPDEFKEEIKKEAEKNDIFMKYLAPILVFLIIGTATALATWYYAKPERTVLNTEEKVKTPPKVDTTKPAVTTPAPATPAPAPTPTVTTYTVQEGDTMSGIANKFNLISTELAAYNGITDVNSLHIGQVLKVPTK